MPDGETSTVPLVATVVLNWYGRPHTIECLRALAAMSYSEQAVVLIDNGCTEFSAAELKTLVPHAQYHHTEKNLGFSGGANLGMRCALAAGAQYVWFVNSDARPEPDALTQLMQVIERDKSIAIVGPKVLQDAHPERLDSIALDLNLCSGRVYLKGHDEVDSGQYDNLHNVRAVTGCAMLVSRTACERLSGFDERFFAYLEDADLCLRALAAGLRVAVAPRARVRHDRMVATSQRQSTASLYFTTRNHLLLMHRHGAGALGFRQLQPLAVSLLSLAYALRPSRDSRGARLRAVLRGIRDYYRGVVGEGSAFLRPDDREAPPGSSSRC